MQKQNNSSSAGIENEMISQAVFPPTNNATIFDNGTQILKLKWGMMLEAIINVMNFFFKISKAKYLYMDTPNFDQNNFKQHHNNSSQQKTHNLTVDTPLATLKWPQYGLQQRINKNLQKKYRWYMSTVTKQFFMLIVISTCIPQMETKQNKKESTYSIFLHPADEQQHKTPLNFMTGQQNFEDTITTNESWMNNLLRITYEIGYITAIITSTIALLLSLCKFILIKYEEKWKNSSQERQETSHIEQQRCYHHALFRHFINDPNNQKQQNTEDLHISDKRKLFTTLPTFFGRQHEHFDDFIQVFEEKISHLNFCDNAKNTVLNYCLMENALIISLEIMQTTENWITVKEELRQKLLEPKALQFNCDTLKKRTLIKGESLAHFAYTIRTTVNFIYKQQTNLHPARKQASMVALFKYGLHPPLKYSMKYKWFYTLNEALLIAMSSKNHFQMNITQERDDIKQKQLCKRQESNQHNTLNSKVYATTTQNIAKQIHSYKNQRKMAQHTLQDRRPAVTNVFQDSNASAV